MVYNEKYRVRDAAEMLARPSILTQKVPPMTAVRWTRHRRRVLAGYLYISPWLIGFVCFSFGPILASLWLSFTNYSISTPRFIGLQNYQFMLFKDPLFWGSVRRTLYFAMSVVLLGISGSLGLALLLNTGLRGVRFYRTAFFLPSVIPIVSSALLWDWFLQPEYGLANGLLRMINITGLEWLDGRAWAIPSIVLIRLWATVGGTQMIVFLAGLQGIPQELYDAAHVDGADRRHQFWHITLPLLSPTLFFNLVIGVIGGLQVFAVAYVLTEGGPAYATWFYLLHLYDQAFRNLEIGYASAMAWFFLLIVMALTLVQFSISRRWVYYETE